MSLFHTENFIGETKNFYNWNLEDKVFLITLNKG